MELDQWQKDVLDTDGNIVLRSGRQCGKSTVISIKAAEFALNNPKSSIMIISATERQAYLLFSKVLFYITDNYKKHIKPGKEGATKSEIKLKNGAIIRCLPTGLDGLGIRGYTIHMLIADEAAFINEDVWQAVIPGLVTTGGQIILLSTPFGKEGYFYKCFQDTNFKQFHVRTEDVAKGREEPQRSNMLRHIEEQKKHMSDLQFAQEYLGEFVDELRQLFTDRLIRQVCTEQPTTRIGLKHYLGVDIARLGEDETTYEVIAKVNEERFIHEYHQLTVKKLTTETTDEIIKLDKSWKFEKIGVDDAGVGAGVFDMLMREAQTNNKTIGLNNAKRNLDRKDKQKKTLLKEDMYMNFLNLLEKGKLKLINNGDLIESLKSVQYEYQVLGNRPAKLRIFGNYTHIVEGLIRAAWLASADKSLNLWFDYI